MLHAACVAENAPDERSRATSKRVSKVTRDKHRFARTGVTGGSYADWKKWAYAQRAVEWEDPFSCPVAMEESIMEALRATYTFTVARVRQQVFSEALEWQAQRASEQIVKERESMISALERADQAMKASGKTSEWMKGCDAQTLAASSAANGPLLEALLEATEYIDKRCVELLREGASMFDALERSGVGTPNECEETKTATALRNTCARSNLSLLESLHADPSAEELLKITQDDAKLGRMSAPVSAADVDLSSILLHPRFGIEQTKEDGSKKLRAVDNFSWSAETSRSKSVIKEGSINGHTFPQEKMKHDTLDMLAQALVAFKETVGCVPGLLKVRSPNARNLLPQSRKQFEGRHRLSVQAGSDQSHASLGLRCRVPSQRRGKSHAIARGARAARTAFCSREIMVSVHAACPFGAIASVHAWERIGAAICHLARRFLKIAAMRYVDDFFAPERYNGAHRGPQSCYIYYLKRARKARGTCARPRLFSSSH